MNPSNEHDIQNQEAPVSPKAAKSAAAKAKEAADRKADKRSNIMYITIAVVFVLVGIAAVIYNSGVLTKNKAATTMAATVNGVEYSAAEVNYHFANSYQTFVSQYGDYISYFGLDTSTSLKLQTYSDDQTWYDYFLDQALTQLSSVVAMVDAAQAAGCVYPDSVQADLDETVSSLELYAPLYGYADAEGYLQANYGTSMTMDLYKELLLKSLQAEYYANSYQESLVYDAAALEAAYDADPNSYDFVDYESVYVYNPVATTDADGNTVEVTDEMSAAALAEAKAIADTLYEDYTAGAALSAVADTNDLAYYSDSTGSSYSGDSVSEWLYDTSRQAGDSAIIAEESNSIYYIVVFKDRYREDYNLVDVRHILIAPETGTLTSEDEGYQDEIDTLKAAAATSAQSVLDEYLAGDQTEDSFATLANTYSTDTGSNTVGGLYEQITKGEMVDTFDAWCFDASRQVGDTDIVETDYGYHVMYYSGLNLPYWEASVTNALLTADFNTWYDGIIADYTATSIEAGLAYVG